MTLGAVLMLGGVTGGRGDQLSGAVGAGGSSSPGGFSLPDLPADWNWGDLPVRLSASETVGYNSNILALHDWDELAQWRAPRRFYLAVVFWLVDHCQLVWPTVILQRQFRSATLSSSGPIRLEYILF